MAGQDSEPVKEVGNGQALVNIALCKYWGKRDETLNLPVTSSLSVSLPGLEAVTTVTPAERTTFIVNGQERSPETAASKRVFDFVNLFTSQPVLVQTESSVPIGAGLASSASGFAALTLALDDLLGLGLTVHELSIAARLGSGSACRSIYTGFVEWRAGKRDDGMDSYAVPIKKQWPGFCVGLLLLSDQEKKISSRNAMKRTRDTSVLYQQWPRKVAENFSQIKHAIDINNINVLGRHAESNALAMHATMMDSWPPIIYWLPETVEAIERVHALRADGVNVYFTMDAGPNVKLLFLEEQAPVIQKAFPEMRVIHP